jgi:hypothetical protein
MNSYRQIAIYAPEEMPGVFTVLIQSAPQLDLLASATYFETFRTYYSDKSPNSIIISLFQEEESLTSGKYADKKIDPIKSTWPDVLCIAFVKYTSQMEKAVGERAGIALVDRIDAKRSLAAIEEKPRKKKPESM